jgi:4-amino-4-deoxy-L-arabinose transferase
MPWGTGGGAGLRRGAILLAFAFALLLPGLGRMAARDSTDARYLEVAREMVASGDWLVPHLAGVAHLHKPPLAYWAAALGFSAFGVSPLGGRLLEQVALAATAGLVFSWARRRLGEPAAWLAAGLLLTTGLVYVSSRALHTDLFQLLFLTGALLALFEGSAGRSGPTALGFALLGVSMLAKGPIALLVALSVMLPFLWLRRGERRLPLGGVLAGIALFAAIGLPWYGALVARDPSLLGWFVEHQIVARATSGVEGHRHGAPYLPVHLLVGTLPWTPLIALSIWRLRPRRGTRTPAADLFLLLWALVPCLLFELFATKLATYLLPAFPAAALLVATANARGLLVDRHGRRALAASAALCGVAALALAGAIAFEAWRGDAASRWLEPAELEAPRVAAAGVAIVGALGLALAAAAARRAPAWALPRAVLVAGLAFAAGSSAVAAGLSDHQADARVVRSVPGARLIQFGVFEAGMLFYTADLERSVVAVERRRVALARRDPSAARLGLRHQDVAAMVAEGTPTFVLAKRSHEERLVADLSLLPVRRSRRFVLLANPSAAAALAGGSPAARSSSGLHRRWAKLAP